jgi:hypothetical protein
MTKRTRVVGTFAAVSLFIMVVAFVALFAVKARAQVVGPLLGIAEIVNILVLVKNLKETQEEESRPILAPHFSSPVPKMPDNKLICYIILGVILCLINFVAVSLGVMAWQGRIDPSHFWHIVPQAVFGWVFVWYWYGRLKKRFPE